MNIRSNRANPTGELHQCAPHDRRNVHPCGARPAQNEQAAQHDEHDKREMEKDDEVDQFLSG